MQAAKGVWKRVLRFLEGGVDDEEEWEYQDEAIDYTDPYEHQDPDPIVDVPAKHNGKDRIKRTNNVVDFETTKRDAQETVTVRIVRPKEIQDATLVCDYLQDSMICIIDMQGTDHNTAQRIADYLGGVSYALRGSVERIDSFIFIMAPEGVKIDSDLQSDLREELKAGGLFKSYR